MRKKIETLKLIKVEVVECWRSKELRVTEARLDKKVLENYNIYSFYDMFKVYFTKKSKTIFISY